MDNVVKLHEPDVRKVFANDYETYLVTFVNSEPVEVQRHTTVWSRGDNLTADEREIERIRRAIDHARKAGRREMPRPLFDH